MKWLIRRFQDVFSGGYGQGDYYPYERRVCVWAFVCRLVFILVPAIGVWEYLGTFELYGSWQFVRAVLTLAAGWIGAFVWADLGPEELFRKWLVGYSYNTNVWPLGTLEGFCGAIHEPYSHKWEELKMKPLRPWDGDPGSGQFGDE